MSSDNIENFRNFLIQNDAYEKFCNALECRSKRFNDCNPSNLHGVINNSLVWSSTPEGSDYWSRLNKLWNRALDKGVEFKLTYKSIW